MVYKPDKWEREYMNEYYRKLGIPIPKTPKASIKPIPHDQIVNQRIT